MFKKTYTHRHDLTRVIIVIPNNKEQIFHVLHYISHITINNLNCFSEIRCVASVIFTFPDISTGLIKVLHFITNFWIIKMVKKRRCFVEIRIVCGQSIGICMKSVTCCTILGGIEEVCAFTFRQDGYCWRCLGCWGNLPTLILANYFSEKKLIRFF